MSLDVYFKDGIQQTIIALAVAKLNSQVRNDGINVYYCYGVLDFALSLSLAYGLEWNKVKHLIVSSVDESLPDVISKFRMTDLGQILKENAYPYT